MNMALFEEKKPANIQKNKFSKLELNTYFCLIYPSDSPYQKNQMKKKLVART